MPAPTFAVAGIVEELVNEVWVGIRGVVVEECFARVRFEAGGAGASSLSSNLAATKASTALRTHAGFFTAGGSCLTGFSKGQRHSVSVALATSGSNPRIHSSMRAISVDASAPPNGIRGEISPRRARISGLCSGCPGTTARPCLLPPAMTASRFSMEKPLGLASAEWQPAHFAESSGAMSASKEGLGADSAIPSAPQIQRTTIEPTRCMEGLASSGFAPIVLRRFGPARMGTTVCRTSQVVLRIASTWSGKIAPSKFLHKQLDITTKTQLFVRVVASGILERVFREARFHSRAGRFV